MIRHKNPAVVALSPVLAGYFGLTERQATYLATLYVTGERRCCRAGIVPAIREAMVSGALHTARNGTALTDEGRRECEAAIADLRRAA